VKIEILYFKGCPNHHLADQRVREVVEELGIQAEVVHVNVKDEHVAQEVQFPGSPTIRVSGADVAPATNGEPFSMRCRVYPTSSGFDGAPDKQAIRAALERSAA
jgi:hypothetical protein